MTEQPNTNETPRRASEPADVDAVDTDGTPVAAERAHDEPVEPAQPKKKSRVRAFLLIFIPLLLAGLFVGWQAWTHRAEGTLSDAPVWTPTGPLEHELPPAPAELPPGCPEDPAEFVPTKFTFDRQGFDVEVLSLGLDADGAAAAPPDDQLRLIGWFNQGPMPGSDQGKVLLTAHTFVNTVALGNELNAGLMTPGDIVRMSDDAGNVACYQYTHANKIWVKDYDPNSDAVYDNVGKPEVALVVCADWNPVTRITESRVVYYYKLLSAANLP